MSKIVLECDRDSLVGVFVPIHDRSSNMYRISRCIQIAYMLVCMDPSVVETSRKDLYEEYLELIAIVDTLLGDEKTIDQFMKLLFQPDRYDQPNLYLF